MFPWQSASDGRDVTPARTYNPLAGHWLADTSHRQRHVGLAIGYTIVQYYRATADIGFLADMGGELLVEICRFFSSLPAYDPDDDRFHIDGAMGPDEFHDGYPGRPGSGVRDNAYTNMLLAWLLHRTIDILQRIDGYDCGQLRRRLNVTPSEIDRWELLSRRLAVPIHADGVISQFEGYENLPDLDWDAYRARYPNTGRLDLILNAEGDSTNNYRVSKQADVLMLFYLLSAEELRDVLARLGYPLSSEAVLATVRLLHQTHQSRLHSVPGRARLGQRPGGPTPRLEHLYRGAAIRPGRHPGRYHPGGCSPRRDGRHRGPHPALLRRARDSRRRALLSPRPAAGDVAGAVHRRLPRPTGQGRPHPTPDQATATAVSGRPHHRMHQGRSHCLATGRRLRSQTPRATDPNRRDAHSRDASARRRPRPRTWWFLSSATIAPAYPGGRAGGRAHPRAGRTGVPAPRRLSQDSPVTRHP